MKESTTKYVKDKSTEIMKLNNDIIEKNHELESIVEEQNKLKAQAEEVTSKKLGKISELAQVLMAIDYLEQKCNSRIGTKSVVKHNINVQGPKNFDDPAASVKYQILQLGAIKNYLFDYIEIHRKVQQAPDQNGDRKGDREIHAYL